MSKTEFYVRWLLVIAGLILMITALVWPYEYSATRSHNHDVGMATVKGIPAPIANGAMCTVLVEREGLGSIKREVMFTPDRDLKVGQRVRIKRYDIEGNHPLLDLLMSLTYMVEAK